MAVATRFHDFQTLGAPSKVDAHARAGKASPNLVSILAYLRSRWGGQDLGHKPYGRPVVGGSRPSTHTWGALDWRYQSPGPGRDVLLRDILPFLIGNSKELGIQAIHDYVGQRIWRPPGTSGRPAGSDGWKRQSKGSQMGQSWALWIHIEVHPDNWFDGAPVEQRVSPTSPPVTPDPDTPYVGVIDSAIYQFATGRQSGPTGDASAQITLGAHSIDLAVAKRNGVKGVLHRAANGLAVDPSYKVVADNAAAVGLAFGAYAYLRPNEPSSPQAHADVLLRALDAGPPPTLPAMADVEEFNGRPEWTPRRYADWLHAWLDRVEDQTGRKPLIYSYRWFWETMIGPHSDEFDGYEFVIASYPHQPSGQQASWPRPPLNTSEWDMWARTTQAGDAGLPNGPQLPAGVDAWSMWQTSSYAKAKDYGFDGSANLDLNIVPGAVFNRWTTPKPPELKMVDVAVKMPELRPDGTNPPTGWAPALVQSGLNVYRRQRGLSELVEDGIYGMITVAAVLDFQKDKGLVPDGWFGTKTWTSFLTGQVWS